MRKWFNPSNSPSVDGRVKTPHQKQGAAAATRQGPLQVGTSSDLAVLRRRLCPHQSTMIPWFCAADDTLPAADSFAVMPLPAAWNVLPSEQTAHSEAWRHAACQTLLIRTYLMSLWRGGMATPWWSETTLPDCGGNDLQWPIKLLLHSKAFTITVFFPSKGKWNKGGNWFFFYAERSKSTVSVWEKPRIENS